MKRSTRSLSSCFVPRVAIAAALTLISTGCVPARQGFSAPSPTAFVLTAEKGSVQVEMASELEADAALIRQWIEGGVLAVERYYDRFPVSRLALRIEHGNRPGVLGGKSYGYPSPLVRLTVGAGTSQEQFRSDWMLTHEMIHLTFPSVPDHQVWAQEGLATYVEPLARHAVGQVPAQQVWRELIEGLPKGSRELARAGLDENGTWGATYWGGALFWFLADIEIRAGSDNRESLRTALRAILNAGGSSQTDWPVAQALERGDAALERPVLVPLYKRMRASPRTIDLDALWHRLGVKIADGEVRFDDTAPQANIRRALVR